MRYVLSKGKQKELLLFAKVTLGLSWRDLAHKLCIGYTTLREWRDEKWSMKQIAFDRLVKICPECVRFREFIVEKKEDNWGRKLGGLNTKQRNHGFLNTKYEKQSAKWKSSGGKIGTRKWHVRMKKEHPEEYSRIQYGRIQKSLKYKHDFNGQKYRNILELEVAQILAAQGNEFEYEGHLRCGNKFYYPDFIIDEIVIECTFWYDAEQKAKELSQKIEDYRKLNLQTVIVTTDRYLTKYSELLTNLNVRVITPDKLTELLDGKSGRVKRV